MSKKSLLGTAVMVGTSGRAMAFCLGQPVFESQDRFGLLIFREGTGAVDIVP